MPRAVDGTKRHDRRKKILKQTKGFWGKKGTLLRTAKDALAKSGVYAYRDRKRKKRDFRRLWITRISAACRAEQMTYSRFMSGLAAAGIFIDRKALSNMAIESPAAFKQLVAESKKALGTA